MSDSETAVKNGRQGREKGRENALNVSLPTFCMSRQISIRKSLVRVTIFILGTGSFSLLGVLLCYPDYRAAPESIFSEPLGPNHSLVTLVLQFLIHSSMSTPLAHSSRRANTLLRLPCKFPDCNRWFGNKASLTQHINRFHPDFLHFVPTVSLTSSGSVPTEQDDNAIEPSSSDLRPPHTCIGGEDVNSQWHGPSAKLYRNYHTKLTGEFPNLTVRPSHCSLIFQMQDSLAMQMACFCLMAAHPFLIPKEHQTTGVLLMTVLSSSSPIYSIPRFRCRRAR